jgi:hypothetical protein
MAKVYDLDKQPTPQEAEYVVKRLSSSFNFLDNTNQPMTPLDDKSLKIATFSLQKYLKVKKKKKKKKKKGFILVIGNLTFYQI